MKVTPKTVGEAITGKEYVVKDFDKTIDLDTKEVFDLNGVVGIATDTWKTINGIVCRRFDHVSGAEEIMAEKDHDIMWFYLPDVSRQDHLAMGLFVQVSDEDL